VREDGDVGAEQLGVQMNYPHVLTWRSHGVRRIPRSIVERRAANPEESLG
jgi:hypothetical protein